MKLGLAGVSLLFSAGDSGPGCNDSSGAFSPRFSGSCPYVTSVGATQLVAGESAKGRQTALFQPAKGLMSGGGFSNQFPRPDWQQDAVQRYLDRHAPPLPTGTFNATGRAYPDVSAIGWNISVYTGGSPDVSGGTSAATPLWASIITLINERRIAAGKSTVGFINPTLYKNPQMFADIVEGGNFGSPLNTSTGTCRSVGFNATRGWDPVTGLGTPKFEELLRVFLDLP